jgi:hypothetical protein
MTVVSRVLSIFALIVVGYIARKAKAMDQSLIRGLSGFILNVALPFTIITGFDRSIPRSALPDLAETALWTIALHGFSIAAATLAFRKFPDNERKVLSYITVFSNCGFMGLPVVESVFGKIGVMYASIYVVIFQAFIWTYGVALFSGNASKGQLKKALLNPGTISVLIGLVLWFLPFELPGALNDSITSMSNLTTPLSMVVVGATLADVPLKGLLKGKELWIGAAGRLCHNEASWSRESAGEDSGIPHRHAGRGSERHLRRTLQGRCGTRFEDGLRLYGSVGAHDPSLRDGAHVRRAGLPPTHR